MKERGNAFLRRLDAWLGIPLAFPVWLYRRSMPRRRRRAANTRIGLLCMGAIGDALILTALIRGIRSAEPNAWIELVGTKANQCVFPLMPDLDSAACIPVAKPWTLVKYLRKERYDILLDATQWARLGSIACALSGSNLTVGFRTEGQYRSLPYDLKISHSARIHEMENFLALGRAVWPRLEGQPGLNLPEWRKKDFAPIYCHMWPAPGKGRHLKQWPEAAWVELVRELVGRGFKIVLTGSHGDAASSMAFIEKNFPSSSNIASLAGKTSLQELGLLFTEACAVVSVNTGVMHLASLSGAPTLGLHGATNPRRWGPLGPRCKSLLPASGQMAYLDLGFEYPKNAESSMGALGVDQVLSGLAELGCL